MDEEKLENKDENGNSIKTKRKKSKMIIIVFIILIGAFLIVGVAGYLLYILNKPENAIVDSLNESENDIIDSLNEPENAIIDFVSYINGEDWDNAIALIDFQGYITMNLISYEAEDDSDVSYANFDEKYETVFDEVGYSEINDILEYGEENYSEILETVFADYSFTINSVDNVERINDTNLYKVTLTLTISDKTGTYEDETEQYEMYVAKIDETYKIVDGTFPYIIYYFYYAYFSY